MGFEWDMNETNGGSMGFNGILWDFMVFNRGVYNITLFKQQE